LSNTSWFQAQEEEEGRTWVLQPNPGGGGETLLRRLERCVG
jgi:hypothetical protein